MLAPFQNYESKTLLWAITNAVTKPSQLSAVIQIVLSDAVQKVPS